MQETWIPIIDFSDIYEVSNLGNVRSIKRTVKMSNCRLREFPSKRLSWQTQKQGYVFVLLSRHSKCYKRYIHRLVAEAFIPNPNHLPQVNHIDGNKNNNVRSNLEWCTASQNCQHAHDNRIYQNAVGSMCPNAKITEADVIDIRRRALAGEVQQKIADDYGIGRKAITKIINRQRWKHVA